MDILEKIGKVGLLSLIEPDLGKITDDAANAMAAGGISIFEVSLSGSDDGYDCIRNLSQQSGLTAGAGRVRTIAQCERAMAAGAAFIVLRSLRPDVVTWCRNRGVAVIPTCTTPTEIEYALDAGISTIRYAPVKAYGGFAACAALANEYAKENLKFIVDGGPEVTSFDGIFAKRYITAISVPWTCHEAAAKGDFEAIREYALALTRKQLGLGFVHMGINQPDATKSKEVASIYADLFQLPLFLYDTSDFAGSLIEVTKGNGLGTHGHIGILTNNLERAIYFFEQKGYRMDQNTARIRDGHMFAIYLEGEFGGFAVHLLEKQDGNLAFFGYTAPQAADQMANEALARFPQELPKPVMPDLISWIDKKMPPWAKG